MEVLRASSWLLFMRAACLVALGTSVALLLDYLRPDPSFCSLGSGCGAVRASGLGYIPLGFGQLPVPVLGVLAFGLLFSSTLIKDPETRARVAAPLALSCAAVAAVLIGLQAYIGHFCSLCMIVDSAALLIGALALLLRDGGWQEAAVEEESQTTLLDPLDLMSEGQRVKGVWRDDSQIYQAPNPLVRPAPTDPYRLKLRSWALLAALAVLAPVFFPMLVRQSDVPGVIRQLYGNDRITVVEFFDFQCPHCQDLSPRLASLVQENPKLEIRYGYTPLPGHPDARKAARISICAAEQGKEKEAVHAILQERDFSEEGLLALGRKVASDTAALDRCLASKMPDARIEADTKALKDAGFVGLPTTYVGGIRILGSEADLVYRDAFRRVLEGKDTSGLNPWAYWAGVLLLAVAILLTGRVEPADRQSIPG